MAGRISSKLEAFDSTAGENSFEGGAFSNDLAFKGTAKRKQARPKKPEAAVFGDRPAFDECLLVGRPNMPDRSSFMSRIFEMYDSKRLTNHGPMSLEFERRVAELSGTRHCVATCNGTVAIELAINALNMRGEVIVPSFTFIATVHALWRQGIRPIFCDVDAETHCLDPASVEAAITSNTTGILTVSLWGNSGHMFQLRDIADRHGLKLLVDSAHAFGCDHARPAKDGICDAEVFSFHATKCIQAIEAGAIITDDDELANNLRLMVNFGFKGEDAVEYLGTNGKMNEAEAAMGLASLEAKTRIFDHNRQNYMSYAESLAGIPGLELMLRGDNVPHNFQYIVVTVDPDVIGLTRDELVAALRLENVVARRYFHPGCHRMQPYARLYPRSGQNLPVTEALSQRVMVLPTGLAVNRNDILRLTDRISALVERAGEVRDALVTAQDERLPTFIN